MMRSYLKENDVSIKNGTDVNAVMRDMMSVILEDALDEELDEELGYSKYDYRNNRRIFKIVVYLGCQLPVLFPFFLQFCKRLIKFPGLLQPFFFFHIVYRFKPMVPDSDHLAVGFCQFLF